MSNELKNGIARVDARLLLKMLAYIASHGWTTSVSLAEHLDVSSSTVKRMIANARKQYGVVVSFRRDNSLPGHGEYTIEDWGVFDQTRIMKFSETDYESAYILI